MHLTRLGSLKLFVAMQASEGISRGAIVIPRRNAKRPNVYSSVYDALRSRMEILYRYGARQAAGSTELGELEALRDSIGEVHVGLAEGDGKNVAERVFGELAAKLRGSSDPFKAQARKKAKLGIVTADGRVNRGATRARATAVDVRLAKRQERVRDIAPWIGAMENALFMEIERCLRVLDVADRAIATMLHGHSFFVEGKVSKSQLQGIDARLSIIFNELSSFRAAPFCSYGDEIGVRLSEAEDEVGQAKPAAAASALTGIRCLIGRARAQKGIEDLIAALSLTVIDGSDASRHQTGLEQLWKRSTGDESLDKTGVGIELFAAVTALKSGDAAGAKTALKSASAKCVP